MTKDSNPVIELGSRASELLHAGDAQAAEQACRSALTKHPENPTLRCILAAALANQGRLARSARELRQVLQQFPDFAKAHEELGNTLLAMRRPVDAIDSFQRSIELYPEQPSVRAKLIKLLQSLGESLAKRGDSAEAITVYERGLTFAPHDGPLLSLLGNELRVVGRQEEAIARYETCITHHPAVGQVYYSLANLKTYRFDDARLAQMEQHVKNASLHDESRVNFHFAIGEAYEDRANHEKAFEHFVLGNSLRRKAENYDSDQVEKFFDRIISTHSRSFCDEFDAIEGEDEVAVPIFVVGLPRSGSTLLEQILSSHSQVEGIQELPDLHRIMRKLDVPHGKGINYPEAFLDLPPESLKELGQQYLDATRKHRTGRKFFVDKLPNNFVFTGAIRMILPQAKIINARRHPLSSCVSTFKQLFYDGQNYSYDLAELAKYYLMYLRLMHHWHEVMPGLVLDVQYEDVVMDQEAQTRRLLQYCGLPFEESCLRFYESDRAVVTASSEQVRQPIYTDSLEIWRPYEPYIDTLIDMLQPVLASLPPEQQPQGSADPA